MQKTQREYLIGEEKELDNLIFPLVGGDRIFFTGDLGSGKTTFIRKLLRAHFQDENLIVRSPTYTYYQSYGHLHHFDLYRLDDISTWTHIGGDEITKNPETILLIEWPEILGDMLTPTIHIHIELMTDGRRRFSVVSSREIA